MLGIGAPSTEGKRGTTGLAQSSLSTPQEPANVSRGLYGDFSPLRFIYFHLFDKLLIFFMYVICISHVICYISYVICYMFYI